MRARVLLFPPRGRHRNRRADDSATAMHARFAMPRLTDAIVGARPEVRIVQIAWHEKRRHVDAFLRAYHARHGVLPRGCHDPGATADHGLRIGRIDFDAARRRPYRRAPTRRWLDLVSLLPRLSRSWPGAVG